LAAKTIIEICKKYVFFALPTPLCANAACNRAQRPARFMAWMSHVSRKRRGGRGEPYRGVRVGGCMGAAQAFPHAEHRAPPPSTHDVYGMFVCHRACGGTMRLQAISGFGRFLARGSVGEAIYY
jgi:hypothetical protein